MSAPPPAIRGSQAAQDAASAWQQVRADKTIQFTPTPIEVQNVSPSPLPTVSGSPLPVSPGSPLPQIDGPIAPATALPQPPPAPKPPPEPSQIGEWLRDLFEPIGKALGLAWPVMQWVLIALGALLAVYAVYRIIAPWLERRRAARPAAARSAEDPGWAPERGEAAALLDEADVLAAAGRFGDAAHLLLRRSVGQIARARPDWVQPATTTREISSIAALPGPARNAFALIAGRVERSLFALRPLDRDDWLAARAAYAEFALQSLPQERQG